MPSLLAGRGAVQKGIKEVLQHLSGPFPGAPQDIILYGPRGNGKTVLLQWAEEHCAADLKYTVLSTRNLIRLSVQVFGQIPLITVYIPTCLDR